MADSSSDSSELRNYLKDLRSRGQGGRVSPSRIPRPEPSNGSGLDVDQSRNLATNRATALLDRVANLGRRKDAKSKLTEDSSPTTSVTISSASKKEVAFDLTAHREGRSGNNSKIPRSPTIGKQRKTESSTGEPKNSPSPKRVVPDIHRLQARRSPSPYHKNCQHSQLSTPNSPEPERGASPKISRNSVAKSKPLNSNLAKPKRETPETTRRNTSTGERAEPSKTQTTESGKSRATESGKSQTTESGKSQTTESGKSQATESGKSVVTETGKSEMSETGQSETIGTKSQTSKIETSKTKSSRSTRKSEPSRTENSQSSHTEGFTSKSDAKNVDSSSKRGSGHQRTSAEYSDTFEETTSKVRSTRQTRSRSLDTGLRRNSRSTDLVSSKTSKRSKSSTVPDWWFPGILPPQHLGGDHLEQLHQLHLGVLDDLFRFQMGLIEKHQQRSETRYKSVNEFVKLNHSYTTWEDYQSDPRTQFFSWQKNSAT